MQLGNLAVNPVLDDQFHLVFTHASLAADTDLHFQQVKDWLDDGKIGLRVEGTAALLIETQDESAR